MFFGVVLYSKKIMANTAPTPPMQMRFLNSMRHNYYKCNNFLENKLSMLLHDVHAELAYLSFMSYFPVSIRYDFQL